jgi:hypothetical protein
MNRLIFWKTLIVTPLIGLLVTACNQPAAPSALNPARYPTPTPITPDLGLQHVGYTEADVPYPIKAKIRNNSGCATTTWEVDAPDTLPEGTLGCDQQVIFAASSTETHEVQVSTVNYLGQVVTNTAKVFVPRPGNTMSDYPLVSDPVLESHELDAGSGDCVTSPVSDGVELDLFTTKCGLDQAHYTISFTLVNPTNQALKVYWSLYIPYNDGSRQNVFARAFEPSQDGNQVLTFPPLCYDSSSPGYHKTVSVLCRLGLAISPVAGGKPLPHGNTYKNIWQGTCAYF